MYCIYSKTQFIRGLSCISSYMFRLIYRAIFRLVFRVVCMYNCWCFETKTSNKLRAVYDYTRNCIILRTCPKRAQNSSGCVSVSSLS
jgi:hypothetical protein